MNSALANIDKRLLFGMYGALLGIAIVCSFLIVAVYLFSLPYIEANKIAALNQAINKVLGSVSETRILRWQNQSWEVSSDSKPDASDNVFAGYDANGKLIAFAVKAKGMGYQDSIELMYGYAPIQQAIIGFSVLENRETPGLGNKIASDPAFLRQFKHLEVPLDDSAKQLAHAITLKKKGRAAQAWQIDSISGATISSRAVATILNDSASRWIPRLQRAQQDERIGLSTPGNVVEQQSSQASDKEK